MMMVMNGFEDDDDNDEKNNDEDERKRCSTFVCLFRVRKSVNGHEVICQKSLSISLFHSFYSEKEWMNEEKQTLTNDF